MFFYNYSGKREISSASYIFYADGCLHPDRIMKEHDFVYMVNGEWEIHQNEEVCTAVSDDVFVLHAGQHHFGTRACSPGTRTMYFHISADPRDSDSGEADDCKGAGESAGLDTFIHCGGHPRIKLLFQEIITVWHEPTGSKTRKCSALFELLLLELADCRAADSCFHDDIVAETVKTISQNPQRFYKTAELADMAGVCVKTLNQRFRAVYGKTAYRYQMDEKICLVRQFLLDYPEAKLQTAALNFGFYDEFHLNKIFKKYAGMPPGLFRKIK